MEVDPLEQVYVPQDPIRFRNHRHSATILVDDFQAPSRVSEVFFAVHIGVAHRACTDHAWPALPPQGIFQQLRRVLLNRDILK